MIEVLVTIIFLTIATLSLLQAFESAFRTYGLAKNRWRASVELWNEAEQIRRERPQTGEQMRIIGPARPLFREFLNSGSSVGCRQWEVLRAEK